MKVTELHELTIGGKVGGGATLKKDLDTLMSFLGSNYETKTEWRRNVGILPALSPANTRSKFGTFQSTASKKMVNFSTSKHP